MATNKNNQPDNKAKKLPDPLQEQVQAYLDKRAAEDPQFAEKYANPKKSIAECVKYLYGEAYKRAAGGRCCYISPDEIYGLAVHYYDEEDIKINSLPAGTSATYASARKEKPVELTEEQKAQAEKAAIERYEAQQLAKIQERERAKAKAEAEKRKAARDAAEARKAQEGEFNLFNLMGI